MGSNLQFLSWSRRGIGASTPVGQVGSRLLVSLKVTVTGDSSAGQRTQDFASAPMAVLGPGDVVGVDPTQILRRTPRPGDHQLEPNYLVAVEFAHPDLPWMFSPTGPASTERSDPWLMLVVLSVEPGHQQGAIGSRPGSPCPVMLVSDPGAVPSPDNAWAFAHVQVHDVDAAGAIAAVKRPSPQAANVRSRLVCPTRLTPNTAYVAAVVPVYEAGRRVGLGQLEADAGAQRWVAVPGLELPAYDFWSFRTGPSGDFETLARKLQPIDVASPAFASLGLRRVTIESKAALLQQADAADLFAPAVHEIPTAIAKSDGPGALAPDGAAPALAADLLHARIKELVDIVAAATDAEPIVGPPLYGRWPAEVTSIDGSPDTAALAPVPDGTAQTWIEELNADPYLRSPAGVATLVVQRDQEQLMTDAWAQLAEVLAANRRMRWSHLYATSAATLHTRLAGATAAGSLRLTSPAFGRLRATDGGTVRAQLDASTLPREAIGAALARTARYAVKADQNQVSVVGAIGSTVEALRTSAAIAIPSRFSSPRLIDPHVLNEVLADAVISDQIKQRLGTDPGRYLKQINTVQAMMVDIADKFADVAAHGHAQQPSDGPVVQIDPSLRDRVAQLSTVAVQLADAGSVQLSPAVRVELAAAQANGVTQLSLTTVAALNSLVANRSRLHMPGIDMSELRSVDLAGGPNRISLSSGLTGALGSLADAIGLDGQPALVVGATEGLRSAALSSLGITAPSVADLMGKLTDRDTALLRTGIKQIATTSTAIDAAVAVPELTVFSLATAGAVVSALQPAAAYQKMLAYAHTNISDLVVRRPGSQFHPAMAAPRFPAPLVDRLKSLDEDWVLGGVKKLPPNSVVILAVNWRFVESFLAGANHEMARELLWRGYPTDLRGSCFQQFWGAPTPDIAAMDSWRGHIGQHSFGGARKEITMLVIKGDLLRRYPSTLITAERGTTAAFSGDTQFTSDNMIAPQLFRGFLGDDVSYAALDISPTVLASRIDDNPRHAWYISMLEPHDEPRFGMDEEPKAAAGSNRSPSSGGALNYSITDDWSWQGRPEPQGAHLDPAAVFAADPVTQSSAVIGASLFQIPFRLLLRAPDYLPPEA